MNVESVFGPVSGLMLDFQECSIQLKLTPRSFVNLLRDMLRMLEEYLNMSDLPSVPGRDIDEFFSVPCHRFK